MLKFFDFSLNFGIKSIWNLGFSKKNIEFKELKKLGTRKKYVQLFYTVFGVFIFLRVK